MAVAFAIAFVCMEATQDGPTHMRPAPGSWRRARYHDPEQAALALRPRERAYSPAGSAFELRTEVVVLEQLTLIRETYGGASAGLPAPGTRTLSFLDTPPKAMAPPRVLGHEVTGASAVLTQDGQEWFAGSLYPGTKVGTVVFPFGTQGLEVPLLPDSQCVLRESPRLSRLAAKHWQIWQRLDGLGGPVELPPAAVVQMEEELLDALRPVVAASAADVCQNVDRSRSARAVELALAYADTVPAERIRVSTLCRVAGVSRRALEYGFQHAFGCGPAKYLKQRRLESARRELSLADPAETVTRVALRWGFSDLSQFAQDYRREFGERPSETLRAPRGSRGRGAAQFA